MSLWERFKSVLQDDAPTPKLTKLTKMPLGEGELANFSHSSQISHRVSPCQWPTLRELTERYHATAFMVAGDDALLLEFAAGMFRSEKQAAVRFAEEHLAALANDLLLPAVPSGVRIATRAEIAKAGPFFEPEAALESTKRKNPSLGTGRMKNAA